MWNKHQEDTEMKEDGLWRLFFLTGLPEAYLALRAGRGEGDALREEPAMTAFVPRPDRTIKS